MPKSELRLEYEYIEDWQGIAEEDLPPFDVSSCSACQVAVGGHLTADPETGGDIPTWSPFAFVSTDDRDTLLCEDCFEVLRTITTGAS